MDETMKEESKHEDVDPDIDIVEEDPEGMTDDLETDDPDDDFELDEEGNIIIPDDEEEAEEGEPGTAAEAEEESADVGQENRAQEKEPDPQAERLGKLQKDHEDLLSQVKDTLSKLGVKTDDVMAGLVKLAAEVDETTPEEYLKKKNEEKRKTEAERLLQAVEFERVARADLAVLHAEYPETRSYKHIGDLPDEILKKYGDYRDLGLPPKEAYAAANPDGIRTNVATAVKKQSLAETKAHLKSTVPKGATDDTSVTMSRAELQEWKEMFPQKSEKEILALYKKTFIK